MSDLITDPRWIILSQSLLTLALVIMGIGIMVGLVKPKQVLTWIVGIAIVAPVVTAITSMIFAELQANFGVVPTFLLSFAFFTVTIIWKLFKIQFTREVLTNIFSHTLYDFIFKPLLSSPVAWMIMLVLFGGIAIWGWLALL